MKNQTSTTWRMGYQRFKDANRQKDARRWSAGMECSLPTGRDWWFPLPRPETHVGQLADSVWSTAFCSAGNGRMGEHRDGAPIRSPCAEPFNETREANWLDFRVMMSQICPIWKIRNLQKMDKLLKYNGTPCRIRYKLITHCFKLIINHSFSQHAPFNAPKCFYHHFFDEFFT